MNLGFMHFHDTKVHKCNLLAIVFNYTTWVIYM